ncbi:hypothetical protein [Marinobacter sp. S0848L]|uniref:hypothetical protein n=1 Tax=Marinobacter sp. S0848L TaxID=2926423 RepID=UPI001FF3471F|nr:hypothetical protein [Marinobacter sp. S0848L]MCK0105652.1 hypothetical protein [Marinobacter sp. S0848L]
MSFETFEYINKNLIDQYFSQVPAKYKKPGKNTVSGLALGMNGPTVSWQSENNNSEIDDYFKLRAINNYLEKENLLVRFRPVELFDDWGANSEAVLECRNKKLVLEKFKAKKVIIPTGDKFPFPDIPFLIIWVSDPDPSLYSDEEFVWKGTFLYLIQAIYDNNKYSIVMSGVSALQALANITTGQKFFERPKGQGEPLGRWNYQHPIEKLVELGGIVSEEKNLISLYKKRYITDEQCYEYKGQERRVNDLLAYPLWIKENV